MCYFSICVGASGAQNLYIKKSKICKKRGGGGEHLVLPPPPPKSATGTASRGYKNTGSGSKYQTIFRILFMSRFICRPSTLVKTQERLFVMVFLGHEVLQYSFVQYFIDKQVIQDPKAPFINLLNPQRDISTSP